MARRSRFGQRFESGAVVLDDRYGNVARFAGIDVAHRPRFARVRTRNDIAPVSVFYNLFILGLHRHSIKRLVEDKKMLNAVLSTICSLCFYPFDLYLETAVARSRTVCTP